ncbi:phosphotransferase family protein [Lentzea sp. JNUCC 0626]|uniref:phosphotransferase family protein n=1 Tax=Lentzea sp. JNUCC 0626 TaxID=3367513 RepID=UPI0037487666
MPFELPQLDALGANRNSIETSALLSDGERALLDNGVQAAVLIDWESAVFGPVEWDLVTIEVHCRRFGFAHTEYDEFCERYGRDVREWSGCRTFKDLRELRMITTNARKSAVGSPQADEVHRRIAQLDDAPSSRWFIV